MDELAAAQVRQEVVVERSRGVNADLVPVRIVRFRVGKTHGRDGFGNVWRLDKYLQAILPTIPRGVLRRWLQRGYASVDGQPAEDRAKLRTGQLVELIAPIGGEDPDPGEPAPVLSILQQEHGWLAVNKPAGQLAHEAGKTMTGTLLNQLQEWAISAGHDPKEVRLVNRIDRDTSGIVLATWDLAVHQRLSAALEQRDLHKEYRAITCGIPGASHGDWREALGEGPAESIRRMVRPDGQPAHTGWRVLATAPAGYALLAITLFTGRQHQIRLHAAHHGLALLGDWVYGQPVNDLPGQALHSHILELEDPHSGTPRRIEAPLPQVFASVWQHLAAGGKPTPRELTGEERSKLGLGQARPAVRLPSWLTAEEFAALEDNKEKQEKPKKQKKR